ncbi:DUF2399 domain-containing protein [Streptomyces sp. NBC_00724]|uniref:DUF2399 domain-containing protein n=1 Tax=Streptomyces sp. NBC_00724 TaxID=2975812 RepID=UPI002ED477FC|nr:DUF2399 domain-containing protein [Streptomyces sp. NBC_00724]
MTAGPAPCPDALCPDGACDGAEFGALLGDKVMWLWEQFADRADRSGDRAMENGTMTITAPPDAAQRAAVLGLLGARTLRPGQSKRINLPELTRRLRARGPGLTPAAVAAHAVRRALGRNTAEQARRAARLAGLQELRSRLLASLPPTAPVRPGPQEWAVLQRTGRVSRIAQHPAPEELLAALARVLACLPQTGRLDRRLLAHDVTGDPHALDANTDLGGLVLAEATACGAVEPGLHRRDAWARLGIDLDTLTGGLLSLNVHPQGWWIPRNQPLILPPWTLERARWPKPGGGDSGWVFVTENPSITAAALTLSSPQPVRLLCTVGTPSLCELAALRRIASAGWRIAVRADFDAAGIQHVRAVLAALPDAAVWRMTADDYTASLHPAPFQPSALDLDRLADTPWDPALHKAMRTHSRAAYEEALIGTLCTELRRGRPKTSPQPQPTPPGPVAYERTNRVPGPDMPAPDQPVTAEACLHRWPSAVQRTELINGVLLFTGNFDERDITTAERTYPGRRVLLNTDGSIEVHPAAPGPPRSLLEP